MHIPKVRRKVLKAVHSLGRQLFKLSGDRSLVQCLLSYKMNLDMEQILATFEYDLAAAIMLGLLVHGA